MAAAARAYLDKNQRTLEDAFAEAMQAAIAKSAADPLVFVGQYLQNKSHERKKALAMASPTPHAVDASLHVSWPPAPYNRTGGVTQTPCEKLRVRGARHNPPNPRRFFVHSPVVILLTSL